MGRWRGMKTFDRGSGSGGSGNISITGELYAKVAARAKAEGRTRVHLLDEIVSAALDREDAARPWPEDERSA